MTVRLTPGDVSGDNIIDDQDLLAVLFGFGSTDPDLDITGDGRVDDADLLLVLFGFGQSGAEAFSGARQPANGAVAMQVRIEVEGYQQGFVQLPVVVEAQKHSGGVVYRYEGVLWSNPGEVWISVPEGGRYRVHVVVGKCLRVETTTDEAFRIVSPQAGANLSGESVVRVQVPFRAYQYTDIELLVNGTPHDWAGDIINFGQAPTVDMTVSTDEFDNREYVLTVRDVYGHEDRITVGFYNTVYRVYVEPLFDVSSPQGGEIPNHCTIRATLSQPSSWQVRILALDGVSVIRTYSGTGTSVDVRWDGRTAGGAEADDGAYLVEFVVAGSPTQRKRITNKNRVGDVLILLDKFMYPGGAPSLNEYVEFIKNRLRRVGSQYSQPSIIITSGIDIMKPSIEDSVVVKRINQFFRSRLQLFYVSSHGGNEPRPFFGIGPYTWYSTTRGHSNLKGLVSFDLSELTRNVGYGSSVDPPALVWIDSCRSAGGTLDGGIGQDDFAFASAVFKSGSLGYGVFVGWNGMCLNYGALAPPEDCWTFWRRQFWIEITSGRNFGTAFSRTNTLTQNRGCGGIPREWRPEMRSRMHGAFHSSL